jgi:amino acid adenylation domain-containing protein
VTGSGCLHDLFEAQAARAPGAVAVVAGDRRLTYGELDADANRLARWLRARGVGPDVPVGICLDRSLELVVAVYGVLKAGGAYVPLDPAQPPRRVRAMLEAAGAPLVLAQESLVPALGGAPVPALCLDTEWDQVASLPAAAPGAGTGPDNLVYVIYTSGSTGQPKGVMNVHGALRNRIEWMQAAYGLTAADRVLHKTPVSFDVSAWELFWPLAAGARLVLVRPDGHRDAAELVRLIREEGVTTAHFVPAMLSVFLAEEGVEECRSLRRVICSGEALSVELQSRFFARLDAGLHNLYGPTEAAIDVTAWACRPDPGQRCVPIGTPIWNTRIHLLDGRLEPVPDGAAGELYIAGVGLARGYLGRPDLTAERFVPDPAGGPGTRMYRSGDVARRLSGGAIEFLGRVDHQVKLRGFRIELDEIQLALESHPGVRESVVLLAEGPAGDARLVAFLVPAVAAAPPEPARLRAFLRDLLPEHMVPGGFVALDALPLTANGKVDRRALLAPPAGGRGENLAGQRQAEAVRRLARARRRPGG